jgi:hypothetical protein
VLYGTHGEKREEDSLGRRWRCGRRRGGLRRVPSPTHDNYFAKQIKTITTTTVAPSTNTTTPSPLPAPPPHHKHHHNHCATVVITTPTTSDSPPLPPPPLLCRSHCHRTLRHHVPPSLDLVVVGVSRGIARSRAAVTRSTLNVVGKTEG